MSNIISSEQVIIWFQPSGSGTSWIPYGVGENGASMTGRSVSGATTEPVYGRDAFGRPVVIKQNKAAPGDLPSATISLYEKAQVDILMKALNSGCDDLSVQSRIVKCGRLNSAVTWDVIDHYDRGQVSSYSQGDAPSLEFDGTAITNEASITFQRWIRLVQTSLSALSSGVALDLLDIEVQTDTSCGTCAQSAGAPTADKFMIIGVAANAGSTVEGTLLVSVNGGSSFSATTTAPFAATATDYEDVSLVAMQPISKTQVRYGVATSTTVAGVKPQFAYADVEYGDEATTTWTVNTIGAGATGETITALEWLFFDRVYMASAGDLYISEDQLESDPGTAVYTGTTQINGFTLSPDETTVWAFGANDLILREIDQNDVWQTRVGVGDGDANTALAVSDSNVLFLGNGTKIFRSNNEALNAGGWTQLKDFGTNKSVIAIHCVRGSTELVRAVVADSAGVGTVWLSVDGGASWTQTASLGTDSYNAAKFSLEDNNKAFLVADSGTIHLLSEV